ncbi:peptidyl-tRNA hydrolase [Saccharothrix longispora]|uniref:peptidyl-tRNA hydrolase n=1 Tax=Saccharothrix longispora TaxID=33920 RepID=UPI0028FDC338|nr:peptidyl-tRNA hydrolase [Saccharothrix longispora]MBY8848467.1 peptidyl-tRNA hydrolase [Saccharothrix sp. MB29]MDU0292177.1 peptidyl-tRNA hydrolase [Saccharothrix longispora]
MLVDRHHATDEEDPAAVRAMPVVLRIEKADPPSRTEVLEAAAAAAVAVCLDERAAPGGEWHDELVAWVRGRIRKVSRRARGAHWEAVLALPGVTVTVGGVQVRAFVPGKVSELPRELSRLQISGSELPADEPGPVPPGAHELWLNPRVGMTAGKAAAQVGHASMLLAPHLSPAELEEWAELEYRCAVRTPSAADWDALVARPDVVLVRDAGYTEVAPGTATVAVNRT